MKIIESKVSILTIIVGLLLSPLMSQSSTRPEARASAFAQTIQKPYFYEIEFHGKKSFILGTLHVGITAAELPAVVETKFRETRIVYFEKMIPADIVEDSLNDSLSAYIKNLKRRNERQQLLASPFDTQDKTILQNVFHIPLPVIEVLRCQDTMSYFLMNGNYTFPRIQSLDYHFMNLAYKLRLSTAELDTDYLRETAFLKSLESPRNKQLLMELSASKCLLKTQLKHNEYRKQIEENEKWISQYRAGTLKAEEDPIINIRNDAWVDNSELISDLEKGGTFIAVGALHLLGPKGVIKLLSNKGFKIRPLP